MNVLSLFDGISCAYEAFNRADIKVANYYACEIEKHATTISNKRHQGIHRPVNDVTELRKEHLPKIDFLIGGSPCQDLSIAKKERKGLEGDRSSLFWQYVRLKNELKPKYFILENVASMPKDAKDIITKEMGVEPVLFNASLVSAQCRKRLFWTNIPFDLPVDKGILLKDILQPDAEVDERMVVKGKAYCLTASYNGAVEKNSVERKQRTMVKFTETAQTGRNETKKLGYVGENDHQAKRVYDDGGKLPALNVVCNSMVKVGYVGSDRQTNRVYDVNGKAPTQMKGSGQGGATPTMIKVGYIGEGEQYGQGGQAHRVYSEEGKTPTLSSYAPLVKSGKIRKLTPIECERLQGLPDNYTEGVANTNRYRVLGNAFNVDVIAHILSALKTNVSFKIPKRRKEIQGGVQ